MSTKDTGAGRRIKLTSHPAQVHPPDRAAHTSVYGTVNVRPMGNGQQDQLPKTGHRVSRIITVAKERKQDY